jgi:streptomycin 6-kinase
MEMLDGFLTEIRARFGDAAEAWAGDAPRLLGRLQERWELELDDPDDDLTNGLTIPATRAGTDPVTLRLTFPDGWFAEETAALVHWDGRGVTSLIDHDPAGAQLLERPEPGLPLSDEPDEEVAFDRAAGVATKLWIPDPGGITPLGEEAIEWGRTMPGRHHLVGRPFERALVSEAAGLLRELVPTQGGPVLLHGDLRRRTIVSARGGLWLAIDPHPLVGERAFDAASLLRDVGEAELADLSKERLRHRVDRLTERLDLDRDRLVRWAIAAGTDQALWSFEGGDATTGERQIQVVRLLRDLER